MPAGARNWPVSSPAKIPENTAIFPELSHASTGCMVLHALSRPVTPFAILSRRGLNPPLHLHENRPMKRAGEAGKALRADLPNTKQNKIYANRKMLLLCKHARLI